MRRLKSLMLICLFSLWQVHILGQVFTFRNNSPITISTEFGQDVVEAVPYPSTISVNAVSAQEVVTNIAVNLLGVTHNFPRDLNILLVGPQGQAVILMAGAGGEAPVSDISLTFNDNALSLVPENSIAPGAYKPTNYLGAFGPTPEGFPAPAPTGPYFNSLSVFNKLNPNGTWRLYVANTFRELDEGSIAGWSITITTNLTSNLSMAISKKYCNS